VNIKVPQVKFKATLRKKCADGTIVYHENKIINFILKIIDERRVRLYG
jgi:hypothetical protein